MENQINNIFVHASSAFKKPSTYPLLLDELIAELEAYLNQIVEARTKIQIKSADQYQNLKHQITKTLMDILYSVQLSLFAERQTETHQFALISTETEIPLSLFKCICLMSQYSLFDTSCKYQCELILSMLFEKGLVETFRLCLLSQENETGKNKNFTLSQLDEIIDNLLSSDYRCKFLTNIYTLHGGSSISIERSNFEQNLKCIITNIGRVFTEKSNLITRNLKNIRKCRFISDIISHSVKTICNYKNEEFVSEEINRISVTIFNHKSNLSNEQFKEKMNILLSSLGTPVIALGSNSSNKGEVSSIVYVLWLYLDLLRVESLMLEAVEFKSNIEKQKEVNCSNFYTQEMQKLLKKCPYNGDECCNCKKCQCVRRNRESAKLSQEKKRNAVEQMDPMKKRIEELEKRNRELEEENIILRGIVSEFNNYRMKGKSDFHSTIEEVSKVLND